MSNSIEVGEIRTEEIEQAIELIISSVVQLASSHYSKSQIEAWVSQYPPPEVFATWRARRKMLVARKSEKLVGFGQIQFDRKEIVGVHVAPAVARCGIGTMLVDSLENEAVTADLTEIVVQASMNAVDFYEACGYRPVREIGFEFSNGVKSNALYMEKQLSSTN